MLEKRISRRSFIRTTAAGLGGSVMVLKPQFAGAEPGTVAANDRIGLGIIGVGMQGSSLLRIALSLPGVECVGAAETYTGRIELAKEIAGNSIFTTRDYRELLGRPGLDAVIVATPDHSHAQLVKDCCEAGKDVYCEKPMSQVPEEGAEMIAAAKNNKRIVQIGSQGMSSVVSEKAKEIISSGALGRLTLVEATHGRNNPGGAWQYPVPPDASPRTIDWKNWLGKVPSRPFSALHWARWRCWRDYGTGVAGDLFVHMITSIHYITGTNEAPLRAQSTGGIFRFDDGRDVPDTLSTIFTYPQFPLYMRVSQGSATPRTFRFLGTGGILELGGGKLTFSPQDGKDHGPSYVGRNCWPRDLRNAYVRKWHEDNDAKVGESKVATGTQTYVAPPGYSDVREHLNRFFVSVKTRKAWVQDATFGHYAALGCHLANHAYFNKTISTWDAGANKIRG